MKAKTRLAAAMMILAMTLALMLALTLALTLALVAGCSRDGGNGSTGPGAPPNTPDTPEPIGVFDPSNPSESFGYIYVPETIAMPLPDGVLPFDLVYFADKVYIAALANTEERQANGYVSSVHAPRFFSMNLDGTGFAEMAGYAPVVSIEPGDSLYVNIPHMTVDSGGGIWVAEDWMRYRYDLPPEISVETATLGDYEYVDLGSGSSLRKLDGAGAEMFSVDLADVFDDEGFLPGAFFIDDSGNIYLTEVDIAFGSTAIFVLDSGGNMQFQVNARPNVRGNTSQHQFVRMPDGHVACVTNEEIENPDGKAVSVGVLKVIDFEAQDFGETVEVSEFSIQAFTGNDDFNVIYRRTWRDEGIYGFNVETGETTELVDGNISGINAEMIDRMAMTSDGRILCVYNWWNSNTDDTTFELLVLSKVPFSEFTDKTVLTLAALFFDEDLRGAVREFNRASRDYIIYVMDYDEPARLTTELIAGHIPDILVVSHLPYEQLAARGLLADLYPLIDADAELARGDFLDGVLQAAEIDGCLYQLFPKFCISTLVGRPAVMGGGAGGGEGAGVGVSAGVGAGGAERGIAGQARNDEGGGDAGAGAGWDMDEFMAVLGAHPEADLPLGQGVTDLLFLKRALSVDIDEYIDWETGATHFDSDAFVRLLEFAGTLPSERDRGNYADEYIDEYELIVTGRQIMSHAELQDFSFFGVYERMFGGELAFKGYPSESGNGHSLDVWASLSITEASQNKEGAWEFLKMYLGVGWESSVSGQLFPTSKAALERKVESYIEVFLHGEDGGEDGGENGGEGDGSAQAWAGQVLAIVGTAPHVNIVDTDEALWNIISEGASDYFNGIKGIEDAVRIIQNRASIYVSERS